MADETNPSRKDPRKKPRLGRGLSGLIINSTEPAQASDYQPVPSQPVAAVPPQTPAPGEKLREIPLDHLAPNPYQPRQDFDEQEMASLADSIRSQGMLQPLVVAQSSDPSAEQPFILVAGERRLRAARRAGLTTAPCVIRPATAQQMLEWALIENIHRADLNPVERADAYRTYIDRFGLSQEQAAERLGQPRSTVANYLRLLDLSDDIRRLLSLGRLSFGHGKVLAGLLAQPARQLALARKAATEQLSVRALEELVTAALRDAGVERPAQRRRSSKPPYIRDLEEQLSQTVGTRVVIRPARAKNSGRIVIDYYSLDDFDRITGALGAKLES